MSESVSGPMKILVAGDVRGKFKEVFDRVSTVHRKNGPFHLLLCVGDFFPDDYQEDLKIPPAPIQTYILGPTKAGQLPYFPDLSGCELAENVVYLGKRGIYNDSRGLTLAYFSGLHSKSKSTDTTETEFTYEELKNFEIRVQNQSGFKGVDILMTSQWPLGIENMANVLPSQLPVIPSPLISRLAATCKPRYHFSGIEGIHYERAPYRNHQVLAEASQHTTRFISLAHVGNQGKKKWLYAFNIVPMKQMSQTELVKQAEDTTEFPYANIALKDLSSRSGSANKNNPNAVSAPSNQFFYDSSYTGQPQHHRHHRGGGRGGGRGRGDKRQYNNNMDGNSNNFEGKRSRGGGHGEGGFSSRPPPGPCWFCLASPQVEKHLVVSVGESVYLTLARGGLTDDHVLILPIEHIQSTVVCPAEVAQEIKKYKNALRSYFETQNKAVVFFERNFKSPHLQIQAVPIPKEKAIGLKITCLEYAESEEVEMQEFPPNADIFQMTRPGFPYFFMELPDDTKLFIPIPKNFSIQFGRELLASEPILNVPDKVDWKTCKMSVEEETRATQSFRDAFKTFDFTE